MSTHGRDLSPCQLERLPAHLGRYNTVYHHRLMLASRSTYLTATSRVLDFGCGSGAAVYEYRDAGFDAYGFDIASYVNLREPEDRQFFRFAQTGTPANIPDYRVTEADYRMDFADASFDFVFSNSVFEHVQDHAMALREIARVLRPGGLSVHVFPARYCLIEPHLFVPLGGVIRSLAWYRLWAFLGVRNQFQTHLRWPDRARENYHYARTGVNYVRNADLLATARPYFTEVGLAPDAWTVGSLRHPLVRIPMVAWLYSRMNTVVLWLRR